MATYLEYLNAAIKIADFETMEDGQIFASIPRFDGLWAVGETREDAARKLYSALDGWLDVHMKIGNEHPPEINGIDLLAPPRLTED